MVGVGDGSFGDETLDYAAAYVVADVNTQIPSKNNIWMPHINVDVTTAFGTNGSAPRAEFEACRSFFKEVLQNQKLQQLARTKLHVDFYTDSSTVLAWYRKCYWQYGRSKNFRNKDFCAVAKDDVSYKWTVTRFFEKLYVLGGYDKRRKSGLAPLKFTFSVRDVKDHSLGDYSDYHDDCHGEAIDRMRSGE